MRLARSPRAVTENGSLVYTGFLLTNVGLVRVSGCFGKTLKLPASKALAARRGCRGEFPVVARRGVFAFVIGALFHVELRAPLLDKLPAAAAGVRRRGLGFDAVITVHVEFPRQRDQRPSIVGHESLDF